MVPLLCQLRRLIEDAAGCLDLDIDQVARRGGQIGLHSQPRALGQMNPPVGAALNMFRGQIPGQRLRLDRIMDITRPPNLRRDWLQEMLHGVGSCRALPTHLPRALGPSRTCVAIGVARKCWTSRRTASIAIGIARSTSGDNSSPGRIWPG
jgi:hypothetical protein